jgi:hypothetical protein
MATTSPTTACFPLKKRGLSLFSAHQGSADGNDFADDCLFSTQETWSVPLFRSFPKSRDRGFVIVIVVVVVVVAVVIVVAIECARC